jgi:hypothetical protein
VLSKIFGPKDYVTLQARNVDFETFGAVAVIVIATIVGVVSAGIMNCRRQEACGCHVGDKGYVQNFGWETSFCLSASQKNIEPLIIDIFGFTNNMWVFSMSVLFFT